jgi:hypothetical protein
VTDLHRLSYYHVKRAPTGDMYTVFTPTAQVSVAGDKTLRRKYSIRQKTCPAAAFFRGKLVSPFTQPRDASITVETQKDDTMSPR